MNFTKEDLGEELLDEVAGETPPRSGWPGREAWEAQLKELAKRDRDVRWELGECLLEGLPHLPPTTPDTICGHYVRYPDAYTIAAGITGLSRPCGQKTQRD